MPSFSANESSARLTEYSPMLDGGAAVKLLKAPQYGVKDFKAIKPLGCGDMGNVFLVAQRSTNLPYAMKVMRKDVLKKRGNTHRALAERDILKSVNHPFLPILHSHFETETHMFLVMNYCNAGDLNVLRQKQSDKRFSESACRFYGAEVILALEYLHKRNIVYRDLKPENILIQSGGHIMLTDFDLSLDLSDRKAPRTPSKVSNVAAKVSTPRKLEKKPSSKVSHVKAFFACGNPMTPTRQPSLGSQKKLPRSRISPEELYSSRKAVQVKSGPANSFVGTEEYVAPEIVWSRGHGLPVDWWTLGILLYELYYGKTPFKGENRKETFYHILCKPVEYPGPPSSLTDLIRKLLVKEPENRLGTKGGADEIKSHPFFKGVNWDANELQLLSTTPVVPEPFSWEQIEDTTASTGKPAVKNWSFSSSNELPKEKIVPKSPSGPLSLKSIDSSDQDRSADSFLSKHFSGENSTASMASTVSSPGKYDAEADDEIRDTFDLDTRDLGPELQLPAIIRDLKEELRLENNDVIITHQKLFEEVF